MAKQKKENNSFLSTIYLIVLFAVGITVGLTLQTSLTSSKKYSDVNNTQKNSSHTTKQKNNNVSENKQVKSEQKPSQNKAVTNDDDVLNSNSNQIIQKLENELITILVANGILQQDIITQYAKEIKDKKTEYTQYYKEIKLPKNKRADVFDYQFKTLARNSKIELSKVPDDNLGNITYSFYDKDKIYSIVVFKKSEK